jgi:hypothetical protein
MYVSGLRCGPGLSFLECVCVCVCTCEEQVGTPDVLSVTLRRSHIGTLDNVPMFYLYNVPMFYLLSERA